MKTILPIAGLLCVAMGGLWVLQGLGILAWPQESFMIRQIEWSWYGGALAAFGIALVAWSRR